MNAYEKSLFEDVILRKLDRILEEPAYQELSKEQDALQKTLEDGITGAQKKTVPPPTGAGNPNDLHGDGACVSGDTGAFQGSAVPGPHR